MCLCDSLCRPTSGWWSRFPSCPSRWRMYSPGFLQMAGYGQWRSSWPCGECPKPGRSWWRREGPRGWQPQLEPQRSWSNRLHLWSRILHALGRWSDRCWWPTQLCRWWRWPWTTARQTHPTFAAGVSYPAQWQPSRLGSCLSQYLHQWQQPHPRPFQMQC